MYPGHIAAPLNNSAILGNTTGTSLIVDTPAGVGSARRKGRRPIGPRPRLRATVLPSGYANDTTVYMCCLYHGWQVCMFCTGIIMLHAIRSACGRTYQRLVPRLGKDASPFNTARAALIFSVTFVGFDKTALRCSHVESPLTA